jgi:hypothetical protein
MKTENISERLPRSSSMDSNTNIEHKRSPLDCSTLSSGHKSYLLIGALSLVVVGLVGLLVIAAVVMPTSTQHIDTCVHTAQIMDVSSADHAIDLPVVDPTDVWLNVQVVYNSSSADLNMQVVYISYLVPGDNTTTREQFVQQWRSDNPALSMIDIYVAPDGEGYIFHPYLTEQVGGATAGEWSLFIAFCVLFAVGGVVGYMIYRSQDFDKDGNVISPQDLHAVSPLMEGDAVTGFTHANSGDSVTRSVFSAVPSTPSIQLSMFSSPVSQMSTHTPSSITVNIEEKEQHKVVESSLVVPPATPRAMEQSQVSKTD